MGANAGADGISSVQVPALAGAVPVELFELEVPILTRCREFISDSGGAGRQRGGLAQRMELQLLPGFDGAATVSVHAAGQNVPPFGLSGGQGRGARRNPARRRCPLARGESPAGKRANAGRSRCQRRLPDGRWRRIRPALGTPGRSRLRRSARWLHLAGGGRGNLRRPAQAGLAASRFRGDCGPTRPPWRRSRRRKRDRGRCAAPGSTRTEVAGFLQGQSRFAGWIYLAAALSAFRFAAGRICYA